jgi:hypothetical protein
MLIRGSPDGLRHPHPQLVAIPGMGGRDPSERVVAFNWNEWSRSIGIAGRDQPVRALGSADVIVCAGEKQREAQIAA